MVNLELSSYMNSVLQCLINVDLIMGVASYLAKL